MDVNTLRVLTTVVSLIVFIAILVWAFSSRNQEDFEAASQLPLEQD